jgi:hypothetical protein
MGKSVILLILGGLSKETKLQKPRNYCTYQLSSTTYYQGCRQQRQKVAIFIIVHILCEKDAILI